MNGNARRVKARRKAKEHSNGSNRFFKIMNRFIKK